MALIYSEGMLEPEEVKETVLECAQILNESGASMFGVFKDFAGDLCVFNLMNITKIKENE